MDAYEFTNAWFKEEHKALWAQLFGMLKPARLLEIGSFEGASACFAIEAVGAQRPVELHCIDSWQGSAEGPFATIDMGAVEARFHANVARARAKAAHEVALHVHKGRSDDELARLLLSGARGRFDFVYVDASHQAPDALSDAVLAFKLLRPGAVMIFDDYLWAEEMPYGRDPLLCPKPGIDAFVNLHFRKLKVLSAPLEQLYVRKLTD
ncbi:MAG: class I SAM-dependent methyltransferase [Alphaproteobacteria bacterium]|nr:class I SAM-dependent methyltransferase [Alphaproteobacteria bacterium]